MVDKILDALTSPLTGDYRKEKPLSVKGAELGVSLATPLDTITFVEEELKKDKPDYFQIGLMAGVEALSMIGPGIAPAARSLIRKGAKAAEQTDNAIDVQSNVPKVSNRAYKKTVKAYKLFTKGEDGKLYPLFVDADTEIPVGKYMKAVFPEYRFKAENGNFYVPSRGTAGKKGTGDSIKIPDQETRDMLIEAGFLKKGSKAKTIKAVAARPGFHAGDNPTAAHIGPEVKIGGKSYKIRGDDQVWAEVEMPADVDWQAIADSRAVLKKDGTPNVKTAHITDELPFGGYYRYKTNPNMQGNWLISGDMKVNRILDRDEVKRLNAEAGVEDLPTEAELRERLGNAFASGGLVGEDMYQGVDDYQMAEMGMGMSEGGTVSTPRNRWEALVQWWNSEKKEDEDEASAFDRFLESFTGDPIERVKRKKEQGAYNYAEGGAVPDNTAGVDPVSGNEVPIGSLPEEVRDDIPAQLSEGEYVVPADVVRYYGVKFFEDLRAEAKQGWASMEANGRVGGEPVEATGMEMGQDELPFDISELQVVEINEGGYLGGYDEGGSVTTTSPTGNPYATNTVSTKKYVDGQGNVRYVTFSGDTPLSYIPPEFKLEGTEEEAPTTTAAPAPVQQDDGPDIDYDRYESLRREANKFNPETAAFEDYQKELDKASGKAGSVIAGGIGSIGLGSIAGIGISKLIDKENRKRLENLRDATENKVSELQGSSATVDQVSPYADLLTDINNILEGKETEKPKSIAELLGFASKNATGVPTENKGVFSSMLDNIKTSLTEATSWDDDKWRKTGLADEFQYIEGRKEGRSPLWGSEQEALAGAIRSGNDDVVRHYEIINEHRKAAERYKQGKSTGNVMLSQRTMDRIDKEREEEAKKNK